MPVTVLPVENISVKDLAPNPWNPNLVPAAGIELLAESIQDIGFAENIAVVPRSVMEDNEAGANWCKQHPNTKYMIVWGEHRFRVSSLLDADVELPCVVLPESDLVRIKALIVRGNVLRGQTDKRRFTELYKDVANAYGPEAAKVLMGLYSEQQFQKLYQDVKKKLPADMQDTLDAKKDKIKTMDGLAQVLNQLYNEYGDTLKWGFMAFAFGGKLCYLIKMDARLKGHMKAITDSCKAEERDINEVLSLIVQAGVEHHGD